jgi:hypothetical protein
VDVPGIEASISAVYGGRKWILATDAAAGATMLVERLREHGATGVMVVAAVEGVGELPAADRIHYTRATGDTIMTGIRAFLASVEHPSTALVAAVDAFDRDGTAMVLGAGFSRMSRLAARPVYGARPAAWGELEDKTTIDAVWDAAGVTRSPSAVVPVTDAPEASRRLATDLGTVWVADNREGWHGGGEFARWVRSPADEADAVAWMARHADVVRVMPFLDGIPCSIHGFATGDGVAVFLPIEMLILRRVDRPGFLYAQGANYWEPPGAIVDEMREAARSVGRLLRERIGYVGAFGVDGVATSEGFRPTELNPRLSLGHFLQARLAAELPIGDMERLAIAGDLEIDAGWLERYVVAKASHDRRGGMILPVTEAHAPAEARFVFTDEGAATTDDEDEAIGTIRIGPSAFGSVVIVSLEAARIPIGPSLAPRVPQVIALVRELWGVDLPDVAPAPDVHTVSMREP